MDEENNQIRDLNIDVPVTLYVALGEYTVGSTINLVFEDEENGEVKRAEHSATVNEDGIIIIENFKLEPPTEKKEE